MHDALFPFSVVTVTVVVPQCNRVTFPSETVATDGEEDVHVNTLDDPSGLNFAERYTVSASRSTVIDVSDISIDSTGFVALTTVYAV